MRLPAAPKGNGTQPSHKYETKQTGLLERDQTQEIRGGGTGIRRARVEKLVAESAAQGTGTRTARPDPEARHWLYDHHIDWAEPIS
jgi:hypothetical protein